MGERRWASGRQGSLYDWLAVHMWLSLVGPKLESGKTTREAVSYYPSPGYSGLTVTDVPV